MSRCVNISAIIPTFDRTDRLIQTIQEIKSCNPVPAEFIVHVDANDFETRNAILANFPDIEVLVSNNLQGPGGARNKLLTSARFPIVVSFDDDSFPIDNDFFSTVCSAVEAHPEAGIVAMSIIHDGEPITPRTMESYEVSAFVGCGCAYRRDAFLETTGYVPMPLAYGMEEVDLSLQLLDRGWSIIETRNLRVRHATDRSHQGSLEIVAAHISNTALLAFLRYPISLFSLSVAQVGKRVLFSLKNGHVLGILLGLFQIPSKLIRHSSQRNPVSRDTVLKAREIGQCISKLND